MTAIAILELTPEIRKEELVESRMRRAGGVMTGHGASTRIFKVAAVQEIIIFNAFINRLRRAHLRLKALVLTLNLKQFLESGR